MLQAIATVLRFTPPAQSQGDTAHDIAARAGLSTADAHKHLSALIALGLVECTSINGKAVHWRTDEGEVERMRSTPQPIATAPTDGTAILTDSGFVCWDPYRGKGWMACDENGQPFKCADDGYTWCTPKVWMPVPGWITG